MSNSKWWKEHSDKKQPTSKYFQGELMTCRGCGSVERSNPKVNLNWTVIEVDGRADYWCPDCFASMLLRSKR